MQYNMNDDSIDQVI